MSTGYYRYPTIHQDTVVFVCEDDLWTVSKAGGIARRLTSGLGEISFPYLSGDGTQLSFVGREEGQSEIYVMPAAGGPARRITFMGGTACRTAGWRDDLLLFSNNSAQPFNPLSHLYMVSPEGEAPQQIAAGPARDVSFGPNGGMVISRKANRPAYWKRYRGGTAGEIWIDEAGDGQFRPLLSLSGNLATPMWLGQRIYFLSDHQGIGNLYSCLPDGEDLRRHTDHDTYYARNATSDGRRIVYHAGGDIYLFDPLTNSSTLIPIQVHSPQTQRNRKFVRTERYLDSWDVHPKGHSVAISARGKAFTFANWEGAVMQHGEPDGARHRLLTWLNDGQRLIGVTDDGREESFVILQADGSGEPELLSDLDIGRPASLAVNPQKDQILFSNHRYELCFLDLETKELRQIDRGFAGQIAGFDWSPDGEWAVYSVSVSLQVARLKLWQAASGETYDLTQPVLQDVAPAFDPQGNYIYFISSRHFDPVYDNLQFDLNFPEGARPYLITLRKDQPSPFVPLPRAPGGKPEVEPPQPENNKPSVEDTNDEQADEVSNPKEETPEENTKKEQPDPIQIDLDGIEHRVIAFPVSEGRYGPIRGLKRNKVLYSRYPVEGALNQTWFSAVPPAKGKLYSYDLTELKEELLLPSITSFRLSRDKGTLMVRVRNRLRLLKAGAKPAKDANGPGRASGWLNLNRVKVSVLPAAEWRQMYREAWRLQRDQFWTPDMSQVNWLAVYDRYLPLLDRVSSRSEFSDLLWEMQGELGTSHCYELGGDYRQEPRYEQGFLGADLSYDADSGSWHISRIIQGDSWNEREDSPLNRPGLNIKAGDRLLAVNGRRLSSSYSPGAALVNLAGSEVTLSISDGEGEPRLLTVKALRSESPARYREWVESNRRRVHQATDGQIGYVHVPNMGPAGYAEFHRGYLAEVDRKGLIVDVRFNGGGHVSSLILEKLARRQIGRMTARWSREAAPFPAESVAGPMVALTNEYAGSDGDIFSHAFKLMKLGPLIGKRTWGGVVGINPQQTLADGTITTQPEFSFWFADVGWDVENYGTDPDIEVENTPQDYVAGVDTQLDRSIAEIMRLLEANPTPLRELDERPSLALPKLPPR